MSWPALLCMALLGLLAAAPASARCALRHFPAEGGTLAYRSCGHGPTVVILPGGPGLDASYMGDIAEAVAADGRRAILLEQRGTGESRAAIGDGSRLTVAGSVADVEALRRALGAERIAVIGHSFGGAIAQAFAAAHPDHVERLILMDSVGPDLHPTPAPFDSWRKRLDIKQLAAYDAARARGDRLAAMRLKFLGSFHHRDRGIAFLKAMPDAAFHQDVAPLSDDYARHYDVSATARPLFPVIILAGDEDWIRGYEPALRAAYPKAVTILIPHAGHFPWADAPAATRRALHSALVRGPHP
ncbi:MAG: pip 1 [Sphingomonas bacterium]|nr:pip 1 [Sphingomonas bacterium]